MADPQVKVIIGGLEKVGERTMRMLILEATANLIESTPVDSGWARANWVPAIGAPKLYAGTKSPDGSQVTTAAARQQRAIAQSALYKWGQGEAFVSNNVPYIGRLNDGHSQLAPSGFVQAAIERAVRDTRIKINLGGVF